MHLRTVLRVAMLAAFATVSMAFIKTPLPMLPSFLTYDPSEVFAMLGGLAMGPAAGLVVVFLKNLLYGLLFGKFVPVSLLANFVAGGTLVFVSSVLYQAFGRRHLWAAALIGSIAMAVVMIPANYFVFLPYHGIVGEKALATALGGATPFNLIKSLLTSALSVLLYGRLAAVMGARMPARIRAMKLEGRE